MTLAYINGPLQRRRNEVQRLGPMAAGRPVTPVGPAPSLPVAGFPAGRPFRAATASTAARAAASARPPWGRPRSDCWIAAADGIHRKDPTKHTSQASRVHPAGF